jgi:hypothetical protein
MLSIFPTDIGDEPREFRTCSGNPIMLFWRLHRLQSSAYDIGDG